MCLQFAYHNDYSYCPLSLRRRACYLSSSFPPTLDSLTKYIPKHDAWTGLVANANVGGENVHRGALLGAVLGARAGVDRLPSRLVDGLYHKTELEKEIDDFVEAVMKPHNEGVA